jgi:hypothetical protein
LSETGAAAATTGKPTAPNQQFYATGGTDRSPEQARRHADCGERCRQNDG